MNSKIAYGALVFVALLLSGCASKNAQSVVPTPTRIAEHIAVTITTTPMGFYADPDGYYTLQVPASLGLATRLPEENSACKTTLLLADKNSGFSDDYSADIIINVCTVDKKFYPDNAMGNIDGPEAQKATLDGRSGFVKQGKGTFEKIGYSGDVRRYVFYENGKEYSIDWNMIPEHKDMENRLNDVLQSFKFK